MHATALLSGGIWVIRALIRPAAWAEAASVTVVSLSLVDRLLSCDSLPATLRIGYNHAPTPTGAVLEAAKAGDAAALQAALDAGGSTEEADEVRGGFRRTVTVKDDAKAEPGDVVHVPVFRHAPSPPSTAGRLHYLCLGSLRRPPRGPPLAPGGRRQPERSRRGEGERREAEGTPLTLRSGTGEASGAW